MMKTPLLTVALVTIFSAPLPALAADKNQPLTTPDFTKGDTIPANSEHDWNLGPSGEKSPPIVTRPPATELCHRLVVNFGHNLWPTIFASTEQPHPVTFSCSGCRRGVH